MAFFTDILLPAALGLVTVYMAYLGVDVTVNPPSDDKAKRRLKLKFIACGAGAVVLTVIQGFVNSSNQNKLESALSDFKKNPLKLEMPGFLQSAGIVQSNDENNQPTTQPPIRVGAKVRINSIWINAGGTQLVAAGSVTRIWTVRANSQTDAETRSQFVKYMETVKHQNQIIAAGGRTYHTDTTDHPLTNEDIADIKANRVKIYILSHIWWDTKPDGVYLCDWASGTASVGVPLEKIAWHACEY